METLATLRKQLDTTGELLDIVRTMKTMAAVSIRQYERAVESLDGYAGTVQNALQVALKEQVDSHVRARPAPRLRLGAIMFGSDQGLCGPLNEQVATFTLDYVNRLRIPREQRFFLAVGAKAATRLETAKERLVGVRTLPSTVDNITNSVQSILEEVRQWETRQEADHVILFHSRPRGGMASRPHAVDLLPLDREWLDQLEQKRWSGPSLPLLTSPASRLLSSLVQHFLFITLYRAFAESLASEQASRLGAMRVAEQNIRERARELTMRFRLERQVSITTELLELATGFEAIEGSDAIV